MPDIRSMCSENPVECTASVRASISSVTNCATQGWQSVGHVDKQVCSAFQTTTDDGVCGEGAVTFSSVCIRPSARDHFTLATFGNTVRLK